MTPGPGSVDVWTAVPETLGSAQLETLGACLSADERERAAAFALEPARRSFIVARALLRHSLSRYAAVAPAAWRFTRGPHGKPHLDPLHAVGLCFNISHTPGLAACAIANDDVGIDVQSATRPLPPRVLPRYLAPSERDALLAAPENERDARGILYWTLKEAYVKARGDGLSLPLTQIAFDLGASDGRALGAPFDLTAPLWATPALGPGCPHDGREYWLKTWCVSGAQRVAVAIAGEGSVGDASVGDASVRGAPQGAPSEGLRWPLVSVRQG